MTISFPFGSEPAFAPKPDEAEAFESYKTSLLEYVSDQFTQSGVSAVEIVAGPPEEGAINVYFIEKLSPTSRLGGYSVSGNDRFNTEADGEIAIIVRGFNPASLGAVETDAETLTHELGHATGLMHVNPEGASAVMDYDHLDGVTETFQNHVFEITHPPVEGGRVLPATHNPLYHLRRYTDGIPHEELETMGIVPGTWDLPGDINLPIVLQFVFGTSVTAPSSPTGTVSAAIQSDLTLYDVLVLVTDSDPSEPSVLAQYPSISLTELAQETFRIGSLEGVELIAKSTPSGEYDIALSPGNPFDEGLVIYPGLGEIDGFLQLASNHTAGYETLSAISIDTTVVPEPATLPLLVMGLFGLQ